METMATISPVEGSVATHPAPELGTAPRSRKAQRQQLNSRNPDNEARSTAARASPIDVMKRESPGYPSSSGSRNQARRKRKTEKRQICASAAQESAKFAMKDSMLRFLPEKKLKLLESQLLHLVRGHADEVLTRDMLDRALDIIYQHCSITTNDVPCLMPTAYVLTRLHLTGDCTADERRQIFAMIRDRLIELLQEWKEIVIRVGEEDVLG